MRHLKATLVTLLSLALAAAIVLAADKPAEDDDLTFLNKKSTTATSPGPASLPKATNSVFKQEEGDGRRPAVITLSDNEKVRGRISTTIDKPIRIWDPQAKEYRDVPFELIKMMESKLLWEREEKEWHFRESGSDIKEYTGKTYPARELEYIVTLLNGQTITGGIVAPIYVQTTVGGDKTLVLHKRDKGEIGKTLKDLVYIRKIEFTDVPAEQK